MSRRSGDGSAHDPVTARATVGVVLIRPDRLLGPEPFIQEWIAGIERVLFADDVTLLVHVAISSDEELATYRRWITKKAVDGLFLVDLSRDDPRVQTVRQTGLPVVVIGDPATANGFPALWTDDASAMRNAVALLHGRGHRVIGRVSGPSGLAHSQIRTEAFISACTDLGAVPLTTSAVYDQHEGGAAAGRLLEDPTPPTAIVFDDDLMALGALKEIARRGLRVPDDVSILAWDDSALCQLSAPRLSVMGHDVQLIGEIAASMVLDVLAGRAVENREAPRSVFVERESVGDAPARSAGG